MHTEIGQDIREYQETIFFGLNMRQFICSVLGIIAAVALWMALSLSLIHIWCRAWRPEN